jgi:hypothetical protein
MLIAANEIEIRGKNTHIRFLEDQLQTRIADTKEMTADVELLKHKIRTNHTFVLSLTKEADIAAEHVAILEGAKKAPSVSELKEKVGRIKKAISRNEDRVAK